MKAVIIIPARYGSTRYPGKPLVPLKTREGKKSLIQLSWEAANKVSGISEIYVATDDKRIADTCEKFGFDFIMTSSEHPTGTDRVAEAYDIIKKREKYDIIVNVQGD